MSSRAQQKATARERAAQIQAQQARRERNRRLAFAGAATLLVVIVVVALVGAKLLGAGSSGKGSKTGTASAALVQTLSSVPSSAFDSVGAGTANNPPKAITAPALTQGGKPRVLYVGAEYCPYCAAERWAVVTALSRFGSFSNLGTTHSSSSDVYPNTPTLSFHGSSFTSKDLAFTGVETLSNKPTANGSYEPLDTLSAADQKIATKYDAPPYVSGQGGAIPFIDIGGKFVSSGASYDPAILAGKTQQQVADAAKDPSTAIGKAVLGSANVFTAAICQITGDQPSAVCSSSGVKTAAAKLGKG